MYGCEETLSRLLFSQLSCPRVHRSRIDYHSIAEGDNAPETIELPGNHQEVPAGDARRRVGAVVGAGVGPALGAAVGIVVGATVGEAVGVQ